ncbi:helix-turn-helix transcriptional regulator [Rhodococcus sovatensis]|uniref:Helix-turn-helix transcriptional regulator n=1 Tax=Rhodococcus sovatensis TaxID=1805840 RepID=A0ABZ2PIB0_9NOCA
MTANLDTSAVVSTRVSTGGQATELHRRRSISLVPPVAQVPPSQVQARPTRLQPMLTKREIQVLTEWIRSDSKVEVAQLLFLSLGTVNTHLTRIRTKYAAVGRPAPSKAALVARALQDGLIDIAEL